MVRTVVWVKRLDHGIQATTRQWAIQRLQQDLDAARKVLKLPQAEVIGVTDPTSHRERAYAVALHLEEDTWEARQETAKRAMAKYFAVDQFPTIATVASWLLPDDPVEIVEHDGHYDLMLDQLTYATYASVAGAGIALMQLAERERREQAAEAALEGALTAMARVGITDEHEALELLEKVLIVRKVRIVRKAAERADR